MNMVPTAVHYLSRPGTGAFPQITYDEVLQLMAHASTEQTRLIVKTLWHTGARISEVLDIRFHDLDLEKMTLQIRRLKRRKPFQQEIPIPGDLANELRLFARAKRRTGRIFKANRISFWETIHKLGLRVLGRDISPKFTRHGRAYDMVKRGKHPIVISKAFGWASMSTVLAYFHPTMDDLKDAFQN